MKNKILATLLAVCMFVGMAVPAFAAGTTPDINDVGSVTLGKTSIEVVNGIPTNVDDLVKPVFKGADGKTLPSNDVYKITWTMATSRYFNFDKNPEITGNTPNTSVLLTGIVSNNVAPVTVTVKTIKKVAATTISLPKTATAAQGADLELTAKLNGNAPASDANVVWTQVGGTPSVGVNNVYVFNEDAVGTYTVTATIKVGGKDVKASTTVTVAKKIAVESISLPETSAVAVDGKLTLKPTFAPATANTDKTVTWESDDEAVATVKDGVVTGVTEGTCVIRATLKSNPEIKVATVLTVKAKGTTFPSLKNSFGTILAGNTAKIAVVNAAKDAKITYSSYDAKIATVDKNGVITGVKAGTTKIKVMIENAAPLYYTVTVKAKPNTGKPGTGTNVPVTGDVLLTNLF